ncbi:MAG: restriction endonuclease subunit S, partial [Candidatus Dadabacteria bacterium]|nr:restriction endonuclease subunit S [Candidatus Dadabacteria bacterium]
QETLKLKQNDLLVCEGGDIGRTAIWKGEIEECYYQNHIHRLRAKDGDIDPVFYMYWFQFAIQMKSIYGTFGNRTTIPNLSGKTLSKFALPTPALPEQKRIAETLRTIDRKVEHHENKKATLQDFFKVALNNLMKGEDLDA